MKDTIRLIYKGYKNMQGEDKIAESFLRTSRDFIIKSFNIDKDEFSRLWCEVLNEDRIALEEIYNMGYRLGATIKESEHGKVKSLLLTLLTAETDRNILVNNLISLFIANQCPFPIQIINNNYEWEQWEYIQALIIGVNNGLGSKGIN